MEKKELLLSNGNTLYYKVVDGTYFNYAIKLKDGSYEERDEQEMEKVIFALSNALHTKRRVRIWYGDVNTGRSWNEEYDVVGYIGRSCGEYKEPLIIAKSNSYGGPAILTDRIIRIDDIESKRVVYKQYNFHVEPMTKVKTTDKSLLDKGYLWQVNQKKDDGKIVNIANFKNEKSADNYIKFLLGDRYCK